MLFTVTFFKFTQVLIILLSGPLDHKSVERESSLFDSKVSFSKARLQNIAPLFLRALMRHNWKLHQIFQAMKVSK